MPDPGSARTTYAVGAPSRGQVVVLPGLCVAAYLRPVCEALARDGWRAELLEPPGWPRGSAPVETPRTLADLAGSVARALDRPQVGELVLLGQSVGAQLAAHVACARPQLVRHVVLQGPVFDPRWRTVPKAVGRWALDLPRESPRLAATEVPEWLAVGPQRVHHVLRLALADRLEATLESIRCPVSVVVGGRDTLSTPSWQRSLVRAGGSHAVLEGLPHSAAHRDPGRVANAVRDLCS